MLTRFRGPGFRIVEMGVLHCGQEPADLDLNNRFQQVISSNRRPEQILLPTGKFVLKSSDVMAVLGR